MSKAKGAPLPDLDDDELVRRLQPLAESVLPPGQGRGRGAPLVAKPPRKGIEFLLPETVVTEIKTRALQRGVSATVLLLEVLRDAGYSVTDADFTDLRKLPRRQVG